MAQSSFNARHGHGRKKTSHASTSVKANNRRISASQRLQEQLKKGIKTVKLIDVPLEVRDVERIKRELEILKGRIR